MVKRKRNYVNQKKSKPLYIFKKIKMSHMIHINNFFKQINKLSKTRKIVLQWTPSHSEITGNKTADQLAKEGNKLPQSHLLSHMKKLKLFLRTQPHKNGKMDIPSRMTAFTC